MEITDAQKEVEKVLGDIRHPRLASFIALTEEVGELADQIMKLEIYDETTDKADLKGELADCLICLFELSTVYGIDLDTEFQNKIENLGPRAEKWKSSLKTVLKDKRSKLN